MISYLEAKKLLFCNTYYLSSIKILSLDSLDKICFDNIYSNCCIPYFNNSAMDGYAIKSGETKNIKNFSFIYKIIGCQYAGRENNFVNIENFCAIEIMTGALLPKNFDSVIKKEDVEIIYINNVKYISINKIVSPFENVRVIGEDILKYDLIIKKNKIITASDIMLLISLGINYINVYKSPNIVLFCTGEEIINFNSKLFNGSIYNSTYAYLKSFFLRLKINFYYYGKIIDNSKLFVRSIKQIQILDNPEIIISTGGVSKGKCDSIIFFLKLIKATILFNGVYIKPGKPLIFAKLNNNFTYFFGLPGNPVSSIIGIRFFIYPFIRKLFFLNDESSIKIKISHFINKKKEYTNFFKAFLFKKNNEFFVDCLYEQESFKLYSLTQTYFWILLDDNNCFYNVNDFVDVFSYEPYSWRNVLLYDK